MGKQEGQLIREILPTMSQEIESIRNGIERWNDGDHTAAENWVAAEALVYPFREWPDDPIYHGRDGWKKLIDQWLETFDEIEWKIDRLIDTDGEIVALVEMSGKIKGTGAPISQPLGVVFRDFQPDGRAAEVRFFLTWKEAFDEAGLAG